MTAPSSPADPLDTLFSTQGLARSQWPLLSSWLELGLVGHGAGGGHTQAPLSDRCILQGQKATVNSHS